MNAVLKVCLYQHLLNLVEICGGSIVGKNLETLSRSLFSFERMVKSSVSYVTLDQLGT